MATATPTKQPGPSRQVLSQARALATKRRAELDRARDEQDVRVEEAAALALVALAVRDETLAAVEAAETTAGTALKDMMGVAGVTLERAAALVGLTVTEMRRLMRGTVGEETGGQETGIQETAGQADAPPAVAVVGGSGKAADPGQEQAPTAAPPAPAEGRGLSLPPVRDVTEPVTGAARSAVA